MLGSDREQHRFYSKNKEQWCNGKTCAECTYTILQDELDNWADAPTLEQIKQDIASQKQGRIKTRMERFLNAKQTVALLN